MKLTKKQRREIAEEFASVVNELSREHFPAKTQEHQLTARLGQALEDRFSSDPIIGVKVSIITQDLPDKGPGALEKKTGTDLYVGISVDGDFDKGFLVQSKWSDNTSDPKLPGQCERMLAVSGASYVWSYGPNGIRVLRARSVVEQDHYTHGKMTWSDNLENMIEHVLDCTQGDRELGVAPGPGRRGRVTDLLQRIEAKAAVSLFISKEK